MGPVALCSPRILPWDMILWAAAFFLVPTRAPAGIPETATHQGSVVLSVKEIHPVQTWGCLAPKPRSWKHQALKMVRSKQDWELKPEAFATGTKFREHLLQQSSPFIDKETGPGD